MYVFILGLIWFLLPKLLRFFMPFVIGWILALIANPVVRFFEKRLKLVRKHGSWIVITGTLLLVIGLCYLIIDWFVSEIAGFAKTLPDLYDSMMLGFQHIETRLSAYTGSLSYDLTDSVADIFANIDTYLGDLVGALGLPTLSAAGSVFSNLPNLFIQTIFMFLAAYFFITDKEQLSVNIRKYTPQTLRNYATWTRDMFSNAVLGYFRAQFKIMGVIAFILFIGFLILKVDYALLWAILIAILDFIPFLGTGTAIWPWAAFQFLTGNYYMTISLMIIYIICLLVHQLLQPKFVGDTVGMKPLTTLFFMFIGYQFSNVIGMIIAIPIGIIIINLYKAGGFDKIILDIKELATDFNNYLNN